MANPVPPPVMQPYRNRGLLAFCSTQLMSSTSTSPSKLNKYLHNKCGTTRKMGSDMGPPRGANGTASRDLNLLILLLPAPPPPLLRRATAGMGVGSYYVHGILDHLNMHRRLAKRSALGIARGVLESFN